MNNFLKFALFLLILVIGVTALAIQQTFYKPLPDYTAEISLEGLQADVSIYWDDFGVPHIYADNEVDLYFAVGYVQAQERLWQMTLSQIAAEGRFAEFFGEELVDYDRYQRTLGFYRSAELMYNQLDEEDLSILEAYSAGVNAFISKNKRKLPVEFALTGIEPIAWTPVRTIAVARLMAWELNMGWWTEAMYNHLKSKLSAEQFEELRLRFPEDAPTSMNYNQTRAVSHSVLPMLRLEQDLRKELHRGGSHVGSNAWVVDGSKTVSGFPLLAGDPHLGLDMPGKWYEMHLIFGGRNVSGATIPGIPVLVLGQNEHLAWTFTSIMADDTDFFIEQTDPLDKSRYVADSLSDSTAVYAPFEVERQIIKVKDGDQRLLEIRYTDHGPVISDIYPNQHLIDDQVISMQWTGYDTTSNELKALYRMNWAQNFQEFQDALEFYGVPGLNLMYGDQSGNIAMFSAGNIPIREGDPITFRRGWAPEDAWQGYIPKEKMPRVINPENGWIANANNKLYAEGYPFYIATFWEPPSRIERITESLSPDTLFTVSDFGRLQNDSYSVFARKNTPVILDIIRNQQVYNFDEVVSYLENWNYRYEGNETAASLFDAIFLNITKNTLTDEFGKETFDVFLFHENVPVRTLTRFLQDSSSFFDDIQTVEVETKEDIVLKSVQDALFFLSDSLGDESFEWRWEQLHTITFEPPLFAEAAESDDAPAPLKLIVNNVLKKGPYAADGHGMSVNNGQYNWEEPFEMVLGPSIRRIVDFSDLSKTYSVLSTGQSGNPLSRHYGDQIELWLEGNYREFYQDSSLFEVQQPDKMTLKPKN
jgi:penicillin amidase